MKVVPIILSGGAGTRLWPESRKSFPKPFMAMPDGETLIGKTLRRAEALADGGPIITVTNAAYGALTREAYSNSSKDHNRHIFLLEPEARNTAPAIATAAAWAGTHLGGQVCLVILPSDHLINDQAGFVQAAQISAELASKGLLVTFGINPTRPETGYGYIKAGAGIGQGFEVEQFVEKPDLATAERYLASGQYSWNSGMFAFTPNGFQKATSAVAPQLQAGVDHCLNGSTSVNDEVRLDLHTFRQLPAISVDYAVFEKSDLVAVVNGDFDWNDVGSWQAISELNSGAGNHSQGDAIFVNCEDVYVRNPQRLVAAIGVQNLVVVDTPDALLISAKPQSQDVKTVVNQLEAKTSGLTQNHVHNSRSWNRGECLLAEQTQEVYRVKLAPGDQLQPPDVHHRLQLIVLDGTARMAGKTLTLGQSETFSTTLVNDGAVAMSALVVLTAP
ncbi:MAG: mannose-1-phosphate guanylyltransferase/mannose-6-phosphate isomerase [Lysobacterales bacterium]